MLSAVLWTYISLNEKLMWIYISLNKKVKSGFANDPNNNKKMKSN